MSYNAETLTFAMYFCNAFLMNLCIYMQIITQVHYGYKTKQADSLVDLISTIRSIGTFTLLCFSDCYVSGMTTNNSCGYFSSFLSFFFSVLWLILKNNSYFETANSWKLNKTSDLHIAVQCYMMLRVGLRLII